MSLCGCFLAVFLSISFSDLLGPRSGASSLFWFADGVLLSYLLLAPRWRWRFYLAAGLAGMLAGLSIQQVEWSFGLIVIGINLLQVILSLVLLRGSSRRAPDFASTQYLIRFSSYALVTAPLVSGGIFSLLAWALWHGSFVRELVFWTSSVGLGTAVVVPAFVAILRERQHRITGHINDLLILVLVVAVTIGAYVSSTTPLIFLIYPLLLMLVIFRGLAWASSAMIFIVYVGGWMTQQGYGPIARYTELEGIEPGIVHQMYVAAGIVMLYIVAALQEHRHLAERRLKQIASIHNLMIENSRDVIILADLKGNRSFVSSACERLSGWTPKEMIEQGSFGVIHPEDMPKVYEVMKKLSMGDGDYGNFECRIRCKNGDYLWVEASLRSIRNPRTGAPAGVLNMVRDISERKAVERKLQEAYHALEEMAVTDALTGLANRRRFDQALATEWRRAQREQTTLSLLLMDVDHFKNYNDLYGHIRGDSCLKQIAQTIAGELSRPGDLACRFGGEEFAVILPATGNEGAMQIASKILEAIRKRKMRHDGNEAKVVTISIGCATEKPGPAKKSSDLAELADKALYWAKEHGRNQVANGNEGMDENQQAM